jgi:hypothetical protein
MERILSDDGGVALVLRSVRLWVYLSKKIILAAFLLCTTVGMHDARIASILLMDSVMAVRTGVTTNVTRPSLPRQCGRCSKTRRIYEGGTVQKTELQRRVEGKVHQDQIWERLRACADEEERVNGGTRLFQWLGAEPGVSRRKHRAERPSRRVRAESFFEVFLPELCGLGQDFIFATQQCPTSDASTQCGRVLSALDPYWWGEHDAFWDHVLECNPALAQKRAAQKRKHLNYFRSRNHCVSRPSFKPPASNQMTWW